MNIFYNNKFLIFRILIVLHTLNILTNTFSISYIYCKNKSNANLSLSRFLYLNGSKVNLDSEFVSTDYIKLYIKSIQSGGFYFNSILDLHNSKSKEITSGADLMSIISYKHLISSLVYINNRPTHTSINKINTDYIDLVSKISFYNLSQIKKQLESLYKISGFHNSNLKILHSKKSKDKIVLEKSIPRDKESSNHIRISKSDFISYIYSNKFIIKLLNGNVSNIKKVAYSFLGGLFNKDSKVRMVSIYILRRISYFDSEIYSIVLSLINSSKYQLDTKNAVYSNFLYRYLNIKTKPLNMHYLETAYNNFYTNKDMLHDYKHYDYIFFDNHNDIDNVYSKLLELKMFIERYLLVSILTDKSSFKYAYKHFDEYEYKLLYSYISNESFCKLPGNYLNGYIVLNNLISIVEKSTIKNDLKNNLIILIYRLFLTSKLDHHQKTYINNFLKSNSNFKKIYVELNGKVKFSQSNVCKVDIFDSYDSSKSSVGVYFISKEYSKFRSYIISKLAIK